MSAGDFLRAVGNPSTTLQPLSEAGSDVAVDQDLIAVSAPWDDGDGKSDIGQVHLYDAVGGEFLRSLKSRVPTSGGRFGHAVDVSDGKIYVASPFADASDVDSGMVEIFDANTGASLQTILNPTPGRLDHFGWSIAAEGGVVVVGAHLDDTHGLDAGAAHLFDSTTGQLIHSLSPPEIDDADYFGFSVAISDDVVAVGARRADVTAVDDGAVYLFDAETGGFLREIGNPDPQSFDSFGRSVSLSGDLLLVGADGDNSGAPGAGSAYVFSVSTGEIVQTLNNPTPAFVDLFGYSVSISGEHAVVGAIRAGEAGVQGAGAAYVFSTTTGQLIRTWTSPNPNELDVFGAATAIDQGNVVIGAYWDDSSGTDAGAAFVYDVDTGAQRFAFANPTLGAFGYFGYSVAVSGNQFAAGAPFEDVDRVTDVGVVYLMDGRSGETQFEIANPNPAASDAFGAAIAMSGDLLVVGAHRADDGAIDGGVAYVFNSLTGQLISTLRNPLPKNQDYFGSSVAIWNEQVVVGAYRKDDDVTGAVDVGAAFLYDAFTGTLVAEIENPEPNDFDHFAHAVSISESGIAVGAYQDDLGAFNAGSVYVYDRRDLTSMQRIANPSPVASDQFGYAISLSGSTLAVGAPRKDLGDFDAGAVYLYHTGMADPQHVLIDASPKTSGNFGGALSVSDNLLAVGAHRRDFPLVDGAGSVDLFDATTGQLIRQLANPDPVVNDFFGWSVATGSNLTAVGTPLVDGATTDRGSVSLFFSGDNAAPFVLAGGPYVARAGERVPFAVVGLSDDRDANADLLVEWDFDFVDGQFDVDATGASLSREFAHGFPTRTIAVRVTDTNGAESIATSTLTVQTDSPLISVDLDSVTVSETEIATNTGTVLGFGEGDITYSTSVGRVAAAPNGTWHWEYVTTDGPDESQTVTVSASRAGSPTASVTFDLVVSDLPPVLTSQQEVVYVLSGDEIATSGTLENPGADEIVSIVANVGTAVNNGDGTWGWSLPAGDFSGSQAVTVTVTDSDNKTATVDFEVILAGIVADVDSVSVEGGRLASVTGRYVLVDGDSPQLTVSVGEVIDNGDGTWRWTYVTGDGPSDSQTVVASADYGDRGRATTDFDLIVMNVAPTVAANEAVVTVGEGGRAENGGTYTDADGDSIELDVSIGTITDNLDGTWAWRSDVWGSTPTTEVVVTIVDQDGAASTTTFQVKSVEEPPTVSVDLLSVRVLPGESAINGGVFGGGPNVRLTASIGEVVDLGGGRWSWSFATSSLGESQAVRITAADDSGASADVTFVMNVSNLLAGSVRVTVAEGGLAENSGRYVRPLLGSILLSSSVGTIVDNGDGTWDWSQPTTDGPEDSQTVTVWSTYQDSPVSLIDFQVVTTNVAPEITVDADQVSVVASEVAENSGTFFDPGDDTVTLRASVGQVNDNGDGTWSWSVGTTDDFESQEIRIEATDSDSAATVASFMLEVRQRFDGDATSVTVSEGQDAELTGTYFAGSVPVSLTATIGQITDLGDSLWRWNFPTLDGPSQSQTVTLSADFGDDEQHHFTFELVVNNVPPRIDVARASVVVTDGGIATNSGTYADTDTGIVLSATAGAIEDHGDGTWTWSLATTDGPDDSQVVTVTASDGEGPDSAVSFEVIDADATEGPIALDLHRDGVIDVLDLDALTAAIFADSTDADFDLDGNSVVDDGDITHWLATAATFHGLLRSYSRGDANLDGTVDAADLNAMALKWSENIVKWSQGDFNADGFIDAKDLNALALNWQETALANSSTQDSASAAPLPSSRSVAPSISGARSVTLSPLSLSGTQSGSPTAMGDASDNVPSRLSSASKHFSSRNVDSRLARSQRDLAKRRRSDPGTDDAHNNVDATDFDGCAS